MAKQKQPRLQLGDRVRERNRVAGCVATPYSANYKTVCDILSNVRVGSVVGFETRRNSRGIRCSYAMVHWDHLQSPSMHAAFRLEKITPSS